LIPKGKKYGEDYNIDDTINDIGEYLSIVDANSILFFFAILFQSLTKVTLNYSIKEMKKLKKKMTNKEEIEKLEKVIKEMEKAKVLAKSGIGYTS
jgi:hydroxymethylpyrimidine/phosphomethylpyrimidine kinase